MVTMLTACATSGGTSLRTFDRPTDFPPEVSFLPHDNGRGKVWCVTDGDYVRETKHMIRLNHVIDRYECQVQIKNGATDCDLPTEER